MTSAYPVQAFIDGRRALARGDASAAREAFERATRVRPNDPNFNAWLAWASILAGEDEAFALDILHTAARAYPRAMRPEFFLGLAAKRRGDMVTARGHLIEALVRAPNDIEAEGVLKSLGC
jgi:cytochrome c-type biogenesis protein CcmH/NrfG